MFIGANILFSAGGLLLIFLATRRHSLPLALLGLALGAVNLDLLRIAGQIRSEPLFMALIAACLALLARAEPTWRQLLGAGAMAIAAALTRSAGVVVVAAVIGTWLVQRGWRPAGWLAAASLVFLGPWLAWTTMAPEKLAGRSYIADLVLPAPPVTSPGPPPPTVVPSPAPTPTPSAPTAAPAQAAPSSPGLARTLVRRITTNFANYGSLILPDVLGLPRIQGTDVDNWIWVVLLGTGGVAGLWSLFRWWPAAGAALLGYGGLIAIWPYSVGRFLTPMVPLVILALLAGLAALASRRPFGIRRPFVAPLILAVLMLIESIPAVGGAFRRSSQCDRNQPLASAGCYDSFERNFFSALTFIADSTPPTARFLSAKEGVFYYHAGRQVAPIAPLVAASRPDVRGYLSRIGAGYILLNHLKYDEQALSSPLSAMCRELDLVRKFGPGTLLFRIGAGDGPDRAAACEALREYDQAPWGFRAP